MCRWRVEAATTTAEASGASAITESMKGEQVGQQLRSCQVANSRYRASWPLGEIALELKNRPESNVVQRPGKSWAKVRGADFPIANKKALFPGPF